MKVLLVEDDEASAELLSLRLEALGCEVTLAHCVDDALLKARTGQASLVITDLKLAHDPSNGIKLVRALKADPATASIKIIVHSIFVTFPSEAPETLPEVDGYLPKPFRFADLKKLLETLAVHG
jgi:CheY-like chemotaxis protein